MRWSEDLSPLLRSCLGPRGRPKLLSPSSVVTSSSRRLLPLLPSSSPFARIVLRAARALEDGGLSCALLALLLATDPLPRPLAGALHDQFSAEFLLILETQIAWEVDFRELHPLRCLVRTLLSSKPACTLTRVDSEVVCSLVLGAFLQSGGGVGVVAVGTGLAPSHSKVVPGVALPIGPGDEERIRRMFPDGPFLACLFTCSLAGEVDWPAALVSTEEAVEGASLQLLARVVDEAAEGARLLLCQKVVHPRLKKRLHGAGVAVLDRLGGENAARIRNILGDEVRIGDAWRGTVSRASFECLGRSRFLVLSSSFSSSLLLTHHNQEALAELEVVCRQSLSALFRLLAPSPRLLCFGGGCSEITAAVLLAKKVRGNLASISRETSCSPGNVLCSLVSFVRGVAHLCASVHQGRPVNFSTDGESGHLWRQCPPADRCACGTRDASSARHWKRLSDIAGLGDLLPSSNGRAASTPVDGLVPQSAAALEPCDAPQTLSTSRLTQRDDPISVSVPQTTPLQQNNAASVSVPQTFLSVTQNDHKESNPSDSVLSSTAGRDILLDEFTCKRNSLSVAFETSSMLLKTTECIHTSPITTSEEEKKADENIFS